MDKQYILHEIEMLKSIPNPNNFVLALIDDFTEIANRVLPWEFDSKLNAFMIRSDRFRGAFYVNSKGVKIFREEYPAFYLLMKDVNLEAIMIPYSTAN